MKTTVVPAQITSVEDRIAGNLSFKQLLLLITPVFLSLALFVLLPPFTKYHPYKVYISIFIATICLTLAFRIKGRLVVEWIGTLTKYNLRPRFYVYNKNSTSGRRIIHAKPLKVEVREKEKDAPLLLPQLAFNTGEVMNFENMLQNPHSDLHFMRNKKGGLHVHIRKIK